VRSCPNRELDESSSAKSERHPWKAQTTKSKLWNEWPMDPEIWNSSKSKLWPSMNPSML